MSLSLYARPSIGTCAKSVNHFTIARYYTQHVPSDFTVAPPDSLLRITLE